MKKETFDRWYEKNQYLKAFMSLLEDLPIETQCEIAVDIIVKASSMIDRDYTKLIQEISTFDSKGLKRWYDKNPHIHLAIESLRDLTDEQKEEIIQEFSDKILNTQTFEELEEIQ